jgi:hypothetical protein
MAGGLQAFVVRREDHAMPTRHALCEELLKLRSKHADVYAREKEIKALLIADADGENFKEVVDKLGTVKVSAPKEARLTGTAPELVVESFLGMTETQQAKLIEKGVVKIAEIYTGKYYGSVTAELF